MSVVSTALAQAPWWLWALSITGEALLIWLAVRRLLRMTDRRCARQIEAALTIHHRLHHRPVVETSLTPGEAERVGLQAADFTRRLVAGK